MNRLLRLYPRAWQERYGEELSAVLEDRQPGPYDLADLVLGAIDAHLHLRGLGTRSDDRKGIPMSLRLGGFAAVVTGALWGAMFLLIWTESNGLETGPLWIPVLVLANLSLIVALAGLSARLPRDSGAAAFGTLLPIVGVLFILGALISRLPSGNWNFSDYNDLSTAFLILGVFVVLFGSAVFAAVYARTGGLAPIGSVAIVAGVIATLSVMFGSAWTWMPLGGIVFAAGWISLGIDAVRRDSPVAAAGHTRS